MIFLCYSGCAKPIKYLLKYSENKLYHMYVEIAACYENYFHCVTLCGSAYDLTRKAY